MAESDGSRGIKYACLLDTETTGVDPAKDMTIEIAVMLFDVKRAQPVASFASLIKHDSNAAFHINGIPPEMLSLARDHDEVWRCVKWLIGPADVIVAHRAEFDRQFVPKLEKPWVCSKVDITWPHGHRGDSLVQLALSLGLGVASAHRAMADVDTLARIFTRIAEKGHDLEAMLIHALRPKLRCVSLAPYEEREIVKSHGFLWDPKLKQWWRDVPMDEIDKLPFQVRKGTLPTGEP